MRSYKSLITKSLLIASIIFGALVTTASPVKAATVSNALTVDTSAVSDDTTQTTEVGPATSNVTVQILSGILTLEAVPDFSFGSLLIGSSSQLQSNDVDTTGMSTDTPSGQDGTPAGALKMIDSRETKDGDPEGTGPGFSLTASMGDLVSYSGDSKLMGILTLNSIPLVDQNKENVSNSTATDLKTQKQSLVSEGDAQQLINLQSGTYRTGVIQALYNTPDSASLEVPNQENTAPDKSVTKYNSVVTWTLNASPVVK
ncbi:WxL domain-containing protein [Companilactobacillus insicii]|uniref:WxL domain-containing protein n=1 Tax=Companilactobacillus insicii TaxID=1732567 RepID=UPI000F7743B3|nr:WxL domain-containing protein [Companilactobacillus insicii]